jgi:hypothetical protein
MEATYKVRPRTGSVHAYVVVFPAKLAPPSVEKIPGYVTAYDSKPFFVSNIQYFSSNFKQ